jgi:hypothetical protein
LRFFIGEDNNCLRTRGEVSSAQIIKYIDF